MRRSALRTMMLAMALLAVLPARADFEAGQKAWDASRTNEALVEWHSAAGNGDRRAMYALGRLYLQGLGVLQDYVEAHKWLNLAASRGEAAALAERDALAEKMTPAQVAEAQGLARAWRRHESQEAAASEERTTTADSDPVSAVPTRTRTSSRTATDSAQTPKSASSAAAPAPPPDSTATPTSTTDAGPPPPRAIREAQTLLAALGYAPGAADGIWGARTGAAYQAFLDDAGLPGAQTLTPEALRALRAAAKRRGGGTESTGAAGGSAGPSRPAVRPDALHRAAKAGDIDGLKAALAAGVDVNARDDRGRTALMHAVNKGFPLLVEPLLDAKADPDLRATDGATALFMAAVHGHKDMVDQLLQAGADISIKGPTSKTPTEIAKLRNDTDVVELLKKAVADDGAFARAKSSGDFKIYLEFRPDGRHADKARRIQAENERKADEAAFATAKAEGTGAAYATYLESHPTGLHADDAAFARAEWVGTGPAYAAYLELHPRGKRAADARTKSTDPGPALLPKCAEISAGQESDERVGCWDAIVSLPGCHFWNSEYDAESARTADVWSGRCTGGVADGPGTLSVSGDTERPAADVMVALENGKLHGQAVWRNADGVVWEGPYAGGRMHGQWVVREADGSVWEGPVVDGKQHGQWFGREADGRVGGGAFVDGKRQGDWVLNYADGDVWKGRYLDGELHGRWVQHVDDGRVGGGTYVDGKRDGDWVIHQDDGTIGRGRYVNGKQHGAWRFEWYSGGCSLLEFSAGTETDRRDC